MIEKIDNDVIMNIYNEVLEDVLSEVESEDLIVSSHHEARDIAIDRASKDVAYYARMILRGNTPPIHIPEE